MKQRRTLPPAAFRARVTPAPWMQVRRYTMILAPAQAEHGAYTMDLDLELAPTKQTGIWTARWLSPHDYVVIECQNVVGLSREQAIQHAVQRLMQAATAVIGA